MQVLIDNGFDDVESLRFLDMNTLVALGINKAEQVYETIQVILQETLEEQEEGEYEYDGQQHIIEGDMEEEEYEQENAGYKSNGQGGKPMVNLETKQPKSVTQQLIVQSLQQQAQKMSNSGAAQYNKTMKGQQLVSTLQKLTHLQMNNKRIQKIGDEIEKNCKNLKVLYLFDNIIQEIEGLNSLKNLIQLSLYNNQIVKMDGMEGLVSLKKLYLEKNKISRLEGLRNCRQLEELYLSQQDTQTDFTFDDYSLAAIAGSLKYLDLTEARVVEAQPLYYLERLEVLILKRNRIEDFEMHVCPMLQTMSSLKQLDLSDNPVNQIPKYRDQIIILTGNRLQEIDNKKVTQQERSYLMSLVQRKQRQVMGGLGSKEETKQKTGGGQFEVHGKNKTLHMQTDYYGMTNTQGTAHGGIEQEETQFYSPIDDSKNPGNVLKQRNNIGNGGFQNHAYKTKKSININSNSDFTSVGQSHQATKHVPKAAMMMKK